MHVGHWVSHSLWVMDCRSTKFGLGAESSRLPACLFVLLSVSKVTAIGVELSGNTEQSNRFGIWNVPWETLSLNSSRFLPMAIFTVQTLCLYNNIMVADHLATTCTPHLVWRKTVHKKTLKGRTKGLVIILMFRFVLLKVILLTPINHDYFWNVHRTSLEIYIGKQVTTDHFDLKITSSKICACFA